MSLIRHRTRVDLPLPESPINLPDAASYISTKGSPPTPHAAGTVTHLTAAVAMLASLALALVACGGGGGSRGGVPG